MDSGLNTFKNPLLRCASQFSALLLAFSVSFFPPILSAQQNFQWRNFTRINDGLGSNNVRSIASGRMGGIWLATSAGLSYFDGFWQNFDVPGGDVSHVFEDRNGFIWATTDTGIYRGIFNRSVNQIDWQGHYSTETGLIDNRVLVAIQRGVDDVTGNEGEIWIGTPIGVNRFDGEAWYPVLDVVDGQPNVGVQTIYEDKARGLWFGLLPGAAADMLSHYDGVQWRTFGVDNGLPRAIVNAIVDDDAGNLWIGTTEGVAVYDGSSWELLTTINSPLIDNSVQALMRDRNGVIWIGTTSGISLFDRGEWSRLTKANGLVSNNVQVLYESQKDEIWIGTRDNGVSFSDRSWQPITANHGLSDNRIISMFADENQQVWVGTPAGLNRHTSNGVETIEPLQGREIRQIIADMGGRTWLGTDQGLWMTDGNFWQNLRIERGVNEIQAVVIDLDGNIWVSTGILLEGDPGPGFLPNLHRYDGTQWHSELELIQQIDRTIVAMRVDTQGRFFFGTLSNATFDSGLWVLDAELLRRVELPASGDIRAILETADGSIWVGSEIGIHVLDRETLLPEAWLTTEQGLVDNSVQVLYRDLSNRIWIGTADGVSLFEDGQSTRVLTETDGLNSNNVSAITQVGDAFWFGSPDDGISIFKPELTPPDTRITSGPTQGETIGDTSVIFKFEGGDASTPAAELRYKYQIDDKPPVYTDDGGRDKRVLLPNLDEGVHHFTVRAIDREGNTDPVGATAEFAVDSIPPRVDISSPKPSEVIRGPFSVKGTATDETDFLDYQIQIFVGDGLTGPTALETSFVSVDSVENSSLYNWDTLALSDGTYTIRLSARDAVDSNFDQQHYGEATVTVEVDNTPPSVSIQSPLPDSTISGSTTLRIGLDDAHLRQYTLEYSLQEDANDTEWVTIRDDQISESSVAVPWDTSSLDGQIYVRAGAQDIAGNTSRSETVSYRLDNAAARPIVSIIKPVGGATPVSRELNIIGSVNVGIAEDAIIEAVLLEYRILSDNNTVWNEIPSLAGRGRRFNAEEIARWNTEGVPDGEYQLRLIAIDSYGYESETIRNLILDNTRPKASITSPQDEEVLPAGNIDVTGIAADKHLLRYELQVLHDEDEEVIRTVSTSVEDGLLGQWNATNLEGEYTLRLTVRDEAGLDASVEVSVILDASEVTARINSPKPGEFLEETVQITGTVQDENFDYFELSFRPSDAQSRSPKGKIPVVDSGQPKNDEPLAVWKTPRLDEAYELHILGFDLSGKQSEHSVRVFIDSFEPIAEIISPNDGKPLSGRVDIVGTADDAHFQDYQLEVRPASHTDGWAPILAFPSTQPKRSEILGSWTTPPTEEDYEVRLVVTDRSGKTRISSVRVTVDNELPRVRIDEPVNDELVSGRIEISGIAVDTNLKLYRIEVRATDERGDWQTIIQSDATGSDEVAAQWTPPEVEGKYEIRLMAEDSSGNPPAEARVTVIVDRIPPQAEILSPIENQQLPLQVEILGTAHDRNFGEYVIEYSSEDSS
ncbi:MAG: Ig-like domain-containing protein, partial [Candidatus Poribacteria bacterium]|nr:Ig-like domain-containing protein [Candidatus Poribacteria bacterium]